ncbi:MAG: tyrosine-type recombinase/integrase [Bacteroidota bacterium]
MFQHHSSVKVLSTQQEQLLLQNCQKPRDCLIILLMLDAGLRESEVVQLHIGQIDPRQKIVQVRSLKKRDRAKDVFRLVPLTERLLDAFAAYMAVLHRPCQQDHLFPAGPRSQSDHLNRKQVWRIVKRLSGGQVHPHMLRHTFATRLRSAGCSIDAAQKLLGHSDRKTTEVYWHIPQQELRAAIGSIDPDRRKLWKRIWAWFFPRPVPVAPVGAAALSSIHIGRVEELRLLEEVAHKKINLILLGPQGMGKSHLLDRYQHGKIIRIDEMRSAKKLLAGMLLEIYKDKENLAAVLHPKSQGEQTALGSIIDKQSVKFLAKELVQVTSKGEYTLVIDDVTRIPPLGISALEKLNQHFHILCAAREVPLSKASFLSNFQKRVLQPLGRKETTELIGQLTADFRARIEDFEAFKNHIFENTNGNPLFIREMIDRYAKEADLSLETIKDFRHNLALHQIDMSLPVVLLISSLMVLRYIGGEFGDDSGALRFFGGLFLAFALFARTFMRLGKRRTI